jgi:hypothetical protein
VDCDLRHGLWFRSLGPGRAGACAAHLALAGLLLCGGPWACERTPQPSTAPASRPAPETAQSVAERLVSLRAQRRYTELTRDIAPEGKQAVVDFLLACDEFLAANDRLCRWLREEVGIGISRTIDQSDLLDELAVYVGDDLGVFSRTATLLDTHVADGVALVSYRVPNQIAAYTAQFRPLPEGWCLEVRPEQATRLAAAFRDMGSGLEQLRAELEAGHLTAAQIRDQPELLVERTRARLRRGVHMLAPPPAPAGSRAE